MQSKKICKTCGHEKELFHYNKCIIYQTCDIIKNVIDILNNDKPVCDTIKKNSIEYLATNNITWEQNLDFSDVKKKGFDSCGIEWCNKSIKRYFDYMNSKKITPKNNLKARFTIVDNIIMIIHLYNLNSKLSFEDLDVCIYCKKTLLECLEERNFHHDQDILQIIEMDNEPNIQTLFKENKIALKSLGFLILYNLIQCINVDTKVDYITGIQVMDLYTIFIENYKMTKIISDCDKLIGF